MCSPARISAGKCSRLGTSATILWANVESRTWGGGGSPSVLVTRALGEDSAVRRSSEPGFVGLLTEIYGINFMNIDTTLNEYIGKTQTTQSVSFDFALIHKIDIIDIWVNKRQVSDNKYRKLINETPWKSEKRECEPDLVYSFFMN